MSLTTYWLFLLKEFGSNKGTGAGNASTFVNPDSTAAVGKGIKPTRGVPGGTYHFGGVASTTDDYKAKDAFEADSPSS